MVLGVPILKHFRVYQEMCFSQTCFSFFLPALTTNKMLHAGNLVGFNKTHDVYLSEKHTLDILK